jgi:hypothetical protein
MSSLAVQKILESVAKRIIDSGEAITRTTLRRTIGTDETETDNAIGTGIKNGTLILLERGYIDIKKGLNINDFSTKEIQYYPVIADSLKDIWQELNYSDSEYFVENTSAKDSKITGQWTRPDFTLVSYKKFPFVIGYEFDIVTFEVKRPETSNVLAVFESLSHTSAATKGYVVFPVSEKDFSNISPAQANRVKYECAKHGIGLILIDDVESNPKPRHLIKARRREIDHERSADFLDAVLSNEGKARIAKWK